jgi:hypothetical protein
MECAHIGSMRWLILAIMSLIIVACLPVPSEGAPTAKATLNGSEFTVSVDPSDPEQGILKITGKVQSSITDLRDKLTVTLSSNITEMDDGGKTGRYWHSIASFDGAAPSPTRIFKKGDPSASFTVALDPSKCDPQTTRDIPAPTGLSLLTWGKLVLTARYTGSSDGSSSDEARIYPQPFYLVNLSLNSRTHNISAGDVLNFTFNIKNPSNQEEGISLEMPMLEELSDLGWNVTALGIDIPVLVPGEGRDVTIRLVAPDEIPYDDTFIFAVATSTLEIDPDTLEPESASSASFTIHTIESKVDDGDHPIDPDPDGNGDRPSTGSVLAGIAVLTLVVVSLIILVLFFMRGRSGGKDGVRDPSDHSAPVRM